MSPVASNPLDADSLRKLHIELHRAEELADSASRADQINQAYVFAQAEELIPNLVAGTQSPDRTVQWLSGHTLYHLRDHGAREALNDAHNLSVENFPPGGYRHLAAS